MKESSKIFLKQLFKEYYYINSSRIAKEVNRISQREIAYISLETGKIIRHIGVKSKSDLFNLILTDVPAHLYHSAAYYLFPDREMDKKVLLAADLVFDIDADKLTYKGAKIDYFYLCDECHEVYKSKREKCEKCGGKLREIEWLNDLNVAKKETMKLMRILIDEFGFDPKGITVYFSGNRGYHIHVSGGDVENMDVRARLEIADYLKLIGYDLVYDRYPERRTFKRLKRILEGREIISDLNEGEADKLRSIIKGDLDIQDKVKMLNTRLKEKIESYIRRNEGIEIDPVVTTDMHRLIRFPESIHGGTGFIKRKVDDLTSFNPFNDAILLPGRKIDVYVEYSPAITLRGEEYGPFFRERARLPGYVAAFLICKGVAEVE
ncbi:hypothetical protein DRN86_00550 [Candidatus Geothermarchaeota archaeon]|nr:MAG: hypothetical protein DRN86_00550 [Candidatus Geothermarchaeota archaeon]